MHFILAVSFLVHAKSSLIQTKTTCFNSVLVVEPKEEFEFNLFNFWRPTYCILLTSEDLFNWQEFGFLINLQDFVYQTCYGAHVFIENN